jgi:sugar/nucleoside kinase (ribokinase family)
MPLDHDLARTLLPELRAAGCTRSLDVGFQPAWLTAASSLETCQSIDYFLPNEREALLVTGGDVSAYLAFAHRNRLPAAVIKLGPRGAAMQVNGRTYKVASPMVDVVDTTGAGDAFDAGFIDALLDQADAENCLRRACICGGLSTRMAGALEALPRREELRDIYDHTYTS